MGPVVRGSGRCLLGLRSLFLALVGGGSCAGVMIIGTVDMMCYAQRGLFGARCASRCLCYRGSAQIDYRSVSTVRIHRRWAGCDGESYGCFTNIQMMRKDEVL